MDSKTNSTGLGLWTTTSLVVGNMVGSGIFIIPASLAAYGGIGIIGWGFSTLGALLIALVFSYLNTAYQQAHGGPYAYTRESFGKLPGFLVAWGYWNSVWCTNAAIAVALVSYLAVFIPVVGESNVFSIGAGISMIWILTFVNLRSIKGVGNVQLITTILKIMPLLIIGIVGLFFVDPENFKLDLGPNPNYWQSITATTTLTLFAFLGIESATIPQVHIKNPERTISSATKFGTLITALIYLLGSIAVMGIIEPSILAESNAPFADAAVRIGGEKLKWLIALGAIVATFGALNGWILIQGQIPLAAANDGLFPNFFAKTNRHKAPAPGIIFSSILATILMALNFHKKTVEAFTFMMLLSTLNVLVPYLFASLASIKLNLNKSPSRMKLFVSILAFSFSIWMVIGCGLEVALYGLGLLILGIPFYVYLTKSKKA